MTGACLGISDSLPSEHRIRSVHGATRYRSVEVVSCLAYRNKAWIHPIDIKNKSVPVFGICPISRCAADC